MNLSITQQMAHVLVALGLDPALAVLLAVMGLLVGPLLLAIAVVSLFERRANRLAGKAVFTGLHLHGVQGRLR